jgi:two-component SAPR family response regulator
VLEANLNVPVFGPLAGRRILVVEDEYFIAEELSGLLADYGAQVIGPVSDQKKAISLLSQITIDCALLDIDVNGRAVFPLIQELRDRNVPWIYVTGYSEALVPEELHGHAHLEKPVASDALVASIAGLFR